MKKRECNEKKGSSNNEHQIHSSVSHNKNTKTNCNSSHPINNHLTSNHHCNNNTLRTITHDIMNIVDNFIYTKKDLQYDQFDEAFNSLRQSITSVRQTESNFNVSEHSVDIILYSLCLS